MGEWNNSSFIRDSILRYRDLLANFSRRNKELYYRESRGHCINLSKAPKVIEEFNNVIKENFVPLHSTSGKFQALLNNPKFDLSEHFLLEETNNGVLIKRFDKIKLANDKYQNEYGIPGAWLLGPFLCWRDSASYKPADLLISPVFKIPVDIKKEKQKWSLLLEDNRLQLNPSLRLVLRQKWGINLPDQLASDRTSDALDEFKGYIEKHNKKLHLDKTFTDSIPKIPPRYRIIKNEFGDIVERLPINLEDSLTKKELELYSSVTSNQYALVDIVMIDHFNASRSVLLRDYDYILNASEGHPIISELFLGKPIPRKKENHFEQLKKLDSYKEKENYFVVNIDSSQHKAIDKTTNSNVVVIQGPPGTGKSQTITNLIAKGLAEGKKILFVSEKRAALDVVYSRLQEANLGPQCVLIHNSNINKQNLYKSFLELPDSIRELDSIQQWNCIGDQKWNDITEDLDQKKEEINSYYRVLEKRHSPSNILIADILSIYAQFNNDNINIDLAKHFSSYSLIELQKIELLLNELQEKLTKVPNFATHPWLYRSKNAILTESFSQTIKKLIEKIKLSEQSVRNLENKIEEMVTDSQILIASSEGLSEVVELDFDPEWVKFAEYFYLNPNNVDLYQGELDKIIDTINHQKQYAEKVKKDADSEIVRHLESYYSTEPKIYDYFKLTFWKMRKYRKNYLSEWDGSNKYFVSFRLVREAIKSFKLMDQNKFLPLAIEESEPNSVIDAYHLIVPIIKNASQIGLVAKQLKQLNQEQFLNFTKKSLEEIRKYILELLQLKKELETNTKELEDLKKELDQNFNDTSNSGRALDYDLLIETMDDLVLLDQVDMCLDQLNFILNANFSKKMLIDNLLQINTEWGEYVYSQVMKLWLDEIFTENPELRNFNSHHFQRKIEQFKELETIHRISAREFINKTHAERLKYGPYDYEGFQLLKKESNKQKKVLPPRQIMEAGARETMLRLKPCWLMSPLSISQGLPIEQRGIFDIIIFDEASQVRVEDAIPSIYRAKSMVVVGDPKQMPPTNFFSASDFVDDDDDNNDDIIEESILDLASKIYPPDMLEWHYRSRSESLIAFSNRAFYGGRLIAVPNPHVLTEGEVIKFHQINNASFSQSNGNEVEAEFIVDRLSLLLKNESSKSVGIIAMGQCQVSAIEEAIEKKLASDIKFKRNIEQLRHNLDERTDASLFIKNLENVQGDERDVILISVGYAPSAPGKKVWMNFGPLSKQGGGRRLNVAITRAREKIEIFCSFDPSQIPTEEKDFSKNPDLVFFGRYLKYAKAISEKQSIEAKSILDSFGISGAITTRKSSNFNKDVRRRLEDLGYKVSSEIGSSGFYVDLGVHHPVIPTNFLLGIECDGALFHSTPYARDRDKIRQELLESRGWKIVRIWSQDWSKDWKREITKIDTLLEEMLNSSN